MARRLLTVHLFACALILGFPNGSANVVFATPETQHTPTQTIDITAQSGIAWHRADKKFIATGQARAIRGSVTVHGQRLTALYREKPQTTPGSDASPSFDSISSLEAQGNARITHLDRVARAETAVYDVASNLLTLKAKGRPATLVAPDTSIAARDTLTYNTQSLKAVAMGNVVIQRTKKDIQADRVIAYMTTVSGHTTLKKAEAFGHVRIETAHETATSEKALFDAAQGEIVTLTGNVVLIRDEHRLEGDKAIFDLTTGVSRLVSENTTRRIHAIIDSTDADLRAPEKEYFPRQRMIETE